MSKSLSKSRRAVGNTQQVSAGARRLIRASVSDNTARSYRSALKAVDAFAAAAGKPLTDALLTEFITARHEAGVAPATLRMAVAAVSFRARKSDAPSPVGKLATHALAGAVRKGRGRGRGQVAGVQFAQADAAAAQAGNGDGGKSVSGARDAAMLLVASDGLLRVSEVSELTVGDFDAGDGDGGTVTIRFGKTDQSGAGKVQFIRKRTVTAVQRWLSVAGITDGALFRPVDKWGCVGKRAMSPRSVRAVIKSRAEAAGVDGRVSGHSMRVGAAQSLVRAGAGLAELMQAGRWSSPSTAALYTAKEAASLGVVARLRPA